MPCTSPVKTSINARSPKNWLGSTDENVLKLLSDLMAEVKGLADILENHTHPNTCACSQGADIAGISSDTDALKSRLDPIILD